MVTTCDRFNNYDTNFVTPEQKPENFRNFAKAGEKTVRRITGITRPFGALFDLYFSRISLRPRGIREISGQKSNPIRKVVRH